MSTRVPLLAAALILSIPALASGQTGSRLTPAPAQIADGAISDLDRTRRAMYDYAECVVRRSPAGAEKYLATFPGSNHARKRASALSVSDCLSSGQLRFDEALFRGGLYEVLYRIRFRDNKTDDFSTVPVIDYSAGSADHVHGDLQNIIGLRRLADCTVRSGPGEARALILSKIATGAEATAFTKVVPHMSSCLTSDITLKFSKPIFRGVIGEALYRLTLSAGEATSATKE